VAQKDDKILPAPVFVVEDDPVIQQRLTQLLLSIGYQINEILYAQTVAHAKKIISNQPIFFALIDLGLPDGHGIEVIECLRLKNHDIPILVISAWSSQDNIINAIQAGATGYLLKERDDFEIILSIKNILKGGAPIDPFIAQQILAKLPSFSPQKKITTTDQKILLSIRELEILNLVSQGMSNREISEHFNLSKHTIECHIKHIYRKLAVNNRSKAVNTARSLGILD
jgi:DNA-binding NarL/FixJ family response regulator